MVVGPAAARCSAYRRARSVFSPVSVGVSVSACSVLSPAPHQLSARSSPGIIHALFTWRQQITAALTSTLKTSPWTCSFTCYGIHHEVWSKGSRQWKYTLFQKYAIECFMYVTLNLLAILLQSYSIKDVCRFVNVASIKSSAFTWSSFATLFWLLSVLSN